MTVLCNATLAQLTKATRFSYDRASLSAGIVHFGVGNFHRAHQAVYLDDLFNSGRDHDWAIIGTGVMPGDETMGETLSSQDYLTTVVEQEADHSAARVTGSMIEFIPPSERTRLLETLSDPAIRIVSLTVTEGGYFTDAVTQSFDIQHPMVAADAQNPSDPRTAFGLIVAGLRARRASGVDPFTVVSCDNIPHNGVVTRNAVTGLAGLQDAELAAWITDNVAFPNGMVDRITPATGARERKLCADEFAIDDKWPVFCEGFRQWVLEDQFPAGRPSLEEVGVQFVPDVAPYELMKIRILNGGHAAIAYPAGVMDVHFVHEAMADPLISGFLRKLEREEVLPILPPVPGIDLGEYLTTIERRFANPKIADTIRRLCLDGSSRQPKFIVPSIVDGLERGSSVSGLALACALWCRYCYGVTDSGQVIEPNDPNWDHVHERAKLAKADADAWLAMGDVYGNIGGEAAFREPFSNWLAMLHAEGTKATLSRYLSEL